MCTSIGAAIDPSAPLNRARAVRASARIAGLAGSSPSGSSSTSRKVSTDASRVALIQERMDLENELQAADGGVDLVALERDFVRFAKDYSSRKGITYNAWREVGVSPATLAEMFRGRWRCRRAWSRTASGWCSSPGPDGRT